mgnify:CR=1 FL=1
MKRLYGIILAGMIPFLLSVLLFSCIENNYRDIRIDESTRWEPYLALPVGEGTIDVNEFFRQYVPPDPFPSDTTRIFFDNEPRILAQNSARAEYSLDFSIEEYVDSSRYIQKALVFFRVTNHYPTAARMQLYLYRDQQEVFDSVFSEPQQIEPGKMGNDSMVDTPAEQLLKVDLPGEQIERLFVADGVLVHGRVFLENDAVQEIYLFPDQGMEVEVFLRVQLSLRKDDVWEE